MLQQQLSIESAGPAIDALLPGAELTSSLAFTPAPAPALGKAPAALLPAQAPSAAEAEAALAPAQPSMTAQANMALLVSAPAMAPSVQGSPQLENAAAVALVSNTNAPTAAMSATQPAVAPADANATSTPATAVTSAASAKAPAPMPVDTDSPTAAAATAGMALMPTSVPQAGQYYNGSSAAGNATASLAAGFFTESSHVTLIASITVAAVVGALVLITAGACCIRGCVTRRRMRTYMAAVVKTGSDSGPMTTLDVVGGSAGGWLTGRTHESSSPLGLRQAYQPSNVGRQTAPVMHG